ncbi:hypothetical protein [Nitrosospira multiformis]|uniref:hypothetical protein n=1 Tax=Nitrosospira multiformis TaxID=1231 RepID=UPI0015A0083F|nr:hypothetical protein [Nitrosospira multiformis]
MRILVGGLAWTAEVEFDQGYADIHILALGFPSCNCRTSGFLNGGFLLFSTLL